MEMAGIAFGLIWLDRVIVRPTLLNLLELGIAAGLFLFSRYSFLFFVVAIMLVLLLRVVKRKPGAEPITVVNYSAMLLPAIISGLSIVAMTLSHQLWPEIVEHGLSLDAPKYTHQSVLLYHSDKWKLVAANLFSFAALPVTIAVVYYLAVRRWLWRRFMSRPAAAQRRLLDRISVLYQVVTLLLLITIIVSAAGIYPWDIHSRWNAYLRMVNSVAIVAMVAELLLVAGIERKHFR